MGRAKWLGVKRAEASPSIGAGHEEPKPFPDLYPFSTFPGLRAGPNLVGPFGAGILHLLHRLIRAVILSATKALRHPKSEFFAACEAMR